MGEFIHSVTLDREKCRGCTNCIKRCPTEAIRVREGKAIIIENRCIDCGECLRVCPYNAKVAVTDPIEMIDKYKYKVALPAPTIYGQFKGSFTPNQILNAIKKLGFDEVHEVAVGADMVSKAVRKHFDEGQINKLMISSACPAIVRLIQVRFPELIDRLVPYLSPMEIMSRKVKEKISSEKGIDISEIGTFFITPCPAKVTSIKSPVGIDKSYTDGAIALDAIYGQIQKNLKELDIEEPLHMATHLGIGWARAGGENYALGLEEHLSIDGIHNVIEVLEEIEMGRLGGILFLEALSCGEGCVGGPLTVENRFVARVRIRSLSENNKDKNDILKGVEDITKEGKYKFDRKINSKQTMRLDDDMKKALQKIEKIDRLTESLPGLDCGACGSPSCKTFAEDIVVNGASEFDCIFVLREKVRKLAEEMLDLSTIVPQTMAKKEEDK